MLIEVINIKSSSRLVPNVNTVYTSEMVLSG